MYGSEQRAANSSESIPKVIKLLLRRRHYHNSALVLPTPSSAETFSRNSGNPQAVRDERAISKRTAICFGKVFRLPSAESTPLKHTRVKLYRRVEQVMADCDTSKLWNVPGSEALYQSGLALL
jgi:hypothetical protein